MCSGGGRATITQPDYTAFNQRFELQKAAIEQQMNSGAMLKQAQVTAAQKQQQDLLTQLKELKTTRAEEVSATAAQAVRMAALIGPPPPEKSAEAPVVGRARTGATRKGKTALRIERQTPSPVGAGAPLNIT
jgi:hypothetical protein